jgi:hypothetical protein
MRAPPTELSGLQEAEMEVTSPGQMKGLTAELPYFTSPVELDSRIMR